MYETGTNYNKSYEIFETKKPFKRDHNTDFAIAFFNLNLKMKKATIRVTNVSKHYATKSHRNCGPAPLEVKSL